MSLAMQFFLGWCGLCVAVMALLIVPQEISRARRARRRIAALQAQVAQLQGQLDGQEDAYVEAVRISDGWKASYFDALKGLEAARGVVDIAMWEAEQ